MKADPRPSSQKRTKAEVPTKPKPKKAGKQATLKQVEKILESVSDSIIALDTEWRYTYVNEKAAQKFGSMPEQLIGKHIWTEFPEGVGQPFYEACYKAVETQRPISLEEYYPPEDRWLENRIYPSKDGLSIFFHDITESNRAKADLRAAEQRFHLLFDNLPDSVVIIDPQTAKAILFNEAAHRNLGYTHDEFLDLPISEYEASESPEETARHLEEIQREGRTEFETRHHTKSGEVRTVLVKVQTTQINNRPYIQGIFRDITERKEVEEELRKSEERYRTLVDEVNDGFYKSDSKGVLTFANPALARILGFENPEDLIGRSFLEFVPPGKVGDLAEQYQAALSTGVVSKVITVKVIRRDGTIAFTEIKPQIIFEDGLPVGNQGTMCDITERKQAEDALAKAQQNYAELVSSIDGIVWEADARTFQFTFINQQAERLLGYPVARWLEEPTFWKDHIHPDDQEWAVDFCIKETNKRRAHEFEYRMIAKDGRIMWLRDIVSVIVENDAPVKLRGIMVDVTKRKQAETELLELRKAVDTSGEVIFMADPDGLITFVNPEFTRLYGYTATEVIGKTTARILKSGRMKPEDYSLFWQAILSKQTVRGEIVNKTKDGRLLTIESSVNPVINDKGNIAGFLAIQRDITTRKHAEEALRLRESYLTAILENQPGLVWLKDVDGHFLTVNQSFADACGKASPEELTGKTDLDIWPIELAEKYRADDASVIRNKTSAIVEEAIFDRGNITWFETFKTPILDDKGDVIGTTGYSRDITARKQVEETLQSRESILETIAFTAAKLLRTSDWRQSAPEVVQRLGEVTGASRAYIFENHISDNNAIITSRRFEWVNEGIVPQLDNPDLQNLPLVEAGFARWVETLSEGKPIFGLVQDFPASERDLLEAQKILSILVVPVFVNDDWWGFIGFDSCVIAHEWRVAERDALLTAASLIGEAIRNAEVMAAEQTQRTHAQALRDTAVALGSSLDLDEVLDCILENVGRVLQYDVADIVFVDSAGSVNIHRSRGYAERGLADWAKSWRYRLDNFKSLEATSLKWQPTVISDTRTSSNWVVFPETDWIRSFVSAPIIVNDQLYGFIRLNCETPGVYLADHGERLQAFAYQAAQAITNAQLYSERKQAELALQEAHDRLEERVTERTAELLVANTALERASKLKDEFLASMSHELRTPINGILGLSESLEEGVYGKLESRQVEILRVIAESGQHLLKLINDILDVSKIEAGKLELQGGLVEVEALCQASMRMIKQSAFQKRLQFSISNTSNIEVIHGDDRRLKQMLVNLLSNAVKFTPAGGQVGLEVSREGDHAIRFTVWDTGIGIPVDQHNKLFKPFVQLDSSLSRQFSGTGLGLALVRNLAELHGGSVGVESNPGKGSRFHFILPIQSINMPGMESAHLPGTSQAQIMPIETGDNHKGEKRRILLVEDNVTNMLVTSDYLNDKGFQVIEARDGSEAIEHALKQKPDLILMDIQMPGISGLEAIKRLRATPGFDSVPIIALTALAMSGDRERCIQAGANEYMAKPASLKKLAEMIKQLLT